jgi:hypothetical protein
MASLRRQLVLLCFALSAVLVFAESFDVDTRLVGPSWSVVISKWTFLGGGTLTGSLTTTHTALHPQDPWPSPPFLRIVASPLSETSRRCLASGRLSMETYATFPLWTNTSNPRTTSFMWIAETRSDVTVVITHYRNHTLEVKGNILCVNPGGIASSASVLPFVSLYAVVVIANIIVCLTYAFLLFWSREKKRWPPKVLVFFLVDMIFKCVTAMITVGVYVSTRTSADTPASVTTISTFVNVLADILQIAALIVLCSGYSLIRKSTTSREKKIMIATFFAISVLRFASFICQLPYAGSNCDSLIISDTVARICCTGVCVALLERLIQKLMERLTSPTATDLRLARLGGDDEEPLTRFANVDVLMRLRAFRLPLAMTAITPVMDIVTRAALKSSQSQFFTALNTEATTVYVFVIVTFYFATAKRTPLPQTSAKRKKRRSSARPG